MKLKQLDDFVFANFPVEELVAIVTYTKLLNTFTTYI